MIALSYELTALDADSGGLKSALLSLAEVVRAVSGCHGVDVMQDSSNIRRFVFVEKWDSVEARQAGSSYLPKDAFDAVMSATEGKPRTASFNYLVGAAASGDAIAT